MNNQIPPLDDLFEIIKHDTSDHDLLSADKLWENISNKIDSEYHQEMFAENLEESVSPKEKYIQGLSEYIDNECSLQKSKVITEHLAECSICRNNYNSFIQTSNAVKYSFDVQVSEQATNQFWNNLESKLFSQDYSSCQEAI